MQATMTPVGLLLFLTLVGTGLSSRIFEWSPNQKLRLRRQADAGEVTNAKIFTFFDKNADTEIFSGKYEDGDLDYFTNLTPPPEPVRLRAEEGAVNGMEGRVEIFQENARQYSPLCADYWDQTAADVVCRQLGFTKGAQFLRPPQTYNWGNFMGDDGVPLRLMCRGYESRIQDCSRKMFYHFCENGAAGVSCKMNTGCPYGWISFNGACYKVMLDRRNFMSARRSCESMGSSLTYILDPKENNFLSTLLLTKFKGEMTQVWTGGYYMERENPTFPGRRQPRWSWIDTIHSTKTSNVTLWFPGFDGKSGTHKRPDGAPAAKSCIALRRGFPYKTQSTQQNSRDGTSNYNVNYYWWDNESCKMQLPYICQKTVRTGRSDCYNDKGVDYRGFVARTYYGSNCYKWTHANAIINPSTNPGKGLGDHNFCRNPDNDIKPWCWVDPVRAVFGYCAIAECDKLPEPTPAPTLPPTDSAGFGKGGCTPDKFFCPSMAMYSDKCFQASEVCDQRIHCEGGEDEEEALCRSRLCTTDQYYCAKDRYCIPIASKCNAVYDCTDGMDEKNCTESDAVLADFEKSQGMILSGVTHVIPWYSLTLANCLKKCQSEYYCKSVNFYPPTGERYYSKCDLLSQIKSELPADRMIADTVGSHFSPKQDCTGAHACPNGVCIPMAKKCDGVFDCADKSDEFGCPTASATVPPFMMRLTGGRGAWEGRIEVRYQGTWGGICDDKFDINDAKVICKELGFSWALDALPASWQRFGSGNGIFLMNNMECQGTEATINQCAKGDWTRYSCGKDEVAGVECGTSRSCYTEEFRCVSSGFCLHKDKFCDGVKNCEDGSDEDNCKLAVRLTGGSNTKEGLVTATRGPMSGNICDDEFDDLDASVICRMLGIAGKAKAVTDGRFGRGNQLLVLSNLQCVGTEASLENCPNFQWGKSLCTHNEDIGVICDYRKPIEPEPIPTIPPPNKDHPCGQRPILQPNLGRVVGGFDAVYGAFPWQAGIRMRYSYSSYTSHWCGGTILNEWWIVSAAHCYSKSRDSYRVRTGDWNNNNRDTYEQEFDIEQLLLHPRWSGPPAYDYDLALIRVKPINGKGIQFNDYVQPACLPEPGHNPRQGGEVCYVSGWGSTNVEYPAQLKAAEVPIIPNQVCDGYYKGSITDRMQCAGYQGGGIDTCQGDSGGPLVCRIGGKYTIWGATSWGNGCALANNPGVYARVVIFLDWVKQYVYT